MNPALKSSPFCQSRRNIGRTDRTSHDAFSRRPLPTNPLPPDNSPNPDLTALQVTETEALHAHLRLLPALLPSPDLLARTIPLGDDSDMAGAQILLVLLVHGARVLALEFGVAQRDNVASPYLVELHDGSIGQIGVNKGAVGTDADGVERLRLGFHELGDESWRRAVADRGILLAVTKRGCCFGDLGSEALPVALELVLAKFGGRRLVALFEDSVFRVLGFVAGGDDGLAVVDVQDVDVLADRGTAAALGSRGFFAFGQDIHTSPALDDWWKRILGGPPRRVFAEVKISRDLTVVERRATLFHRTPTRSRGP